MEVMCLSLPAVQGKVTSTNKWVQNEMVHSLSGLKTQIVIFQANGEKNTIFNLSHHYSSVQGNRNN